MPTPDGGPAFPIIPPVDETGRSAAGYPYPDSGMTFRDYAAVHILAGMNASRYGHMIWPAPGGAPAVTRVAVQLADELVSALATKCDAPAEADDTRRLRQWLHRIEEACARGDETVGARAIRDAALSALRGKPAPQGAGLPNAEGRFIDGEDRSGECAP